jgi:hypothetical protein
MGVNDIADAAEARRLYRLLQPYFPSFTSDNVGTFTPAFAGSSGGATWTYSVQTGFYTRIGNRCFFNLALFGATRTGTPLGNAIVTNLPFVSDATANSHSPCDIDSISGFTLTGTITQLTARVTPGQAWIEFVENTATAPTAANFLAAGGIGATAIIRASGHYMIG